MLINDRPRCGRCKYWKTKCTNQQSKMYKCPMFQRGDGICELWEVHDEIPDDECDDERKDGER